MNRARPWATCLLTASLALALASGLAACGGAADGNPPPTEAPPTPAATPEPSAPPDEPPAPTTPPPTAETAPTPIVMSDPPTPAPLAAPEVSPPPEPAPRASGPTAAPGESSPPTAEIPAPEAGPLPLLYDTYDLTGAVAAPGHYVFLEDPDDPSTAVTTYEGLRDGSTTALLVHQADGYGASQAALYDMVESGDLVEWRQAADCFVRYQVTEVKPDPTGTAPQKLLAVAWMTYAFTGCSGTVDTTVAATLDWSDLPDLGGTSLTAPVIHGSYQIVPEDWSGATEAGQGHRPPGIPPGPFMGTYGTIETDDLTVARAHPYWREPVLPAGWDFQIAVTGGYETTPVGYCALYGSAAGFTSIVICGDYAFDRRFPAEASWIANQQDPSDWRQGVLETRVIAGRPARVQYSPLGAHYDRFMPNRVLIYDPATNTEYDINPYSRTLSGANIDAVIAIARSLFEPPNAP